MGQQSWVDRELGYSRSGGRLLPAQSIPKASQSLQKPLKVLPKTPQSLPRVIAGLRRGPKGSPEPKRGKERKSNPIKDSGSGRETPLETGAILLCGETAFSHYRSVKIQKSLKNAPRINFSVGLFFRTCSNRFSVVFEQKWGVPPSTSASENQRFRGSVKRGQRRWGMVGTTFPPDVTNCDYCPNRPYTRMHAGHYVLSSVS